MLKPESEILLLVGLLRALVRVVVGLDDLGGLREGEVLAGLLVDCHGGRKLAGQNLIIEPGGKANYLQDVPSFFF